MADNNPHLVFVRQEPVRPRRTRGGGRGAPKPEDPQAHAAQLADELDEVRETPAEAGFDPRRLLKLTVKGIAPDELAAIPGLEVVWQENEEQLVLFADEAGLDEFKARLERVRRGQEATRSDILFAVQAFEALTPEDRKGLALRTEGVPTTPRFILDVELWPQELLPRRRAMVEAFRQTCARLGADVLDVLAQQSVVVVRVRTDVNGLNELLKLRDVRIVDLPPRYQFDLSLVRLPISDLPPVPAPPADAPGIVVLDSGIVTGHPLLAPAIGDAQDFTNDGAGAADRNGHGTMVAGFGLYGDVAQCAEDRRFVPTLRLFSGRITDANNEGETTFVEKRVQAAVQYFVEHYNCRVFNLSFGDARKPYDGKHVGPLAAVLDELSRQFNILFIVSAGNFEGTDNTPQDWRGEYPRYLSEPDARLIDPAPSLNVLTVGSLARYEITHQTTRFPNDPAHQPIARRNQPSPFSRTGPGPGGAIKPELVEYGGNWHTDLRTSGGRNAFIRATDLAEMSTAHDFAGGNLFRRGSGTSFSAPKVAHIAAQLVREYPNASPNLLRALLVAHAKCPDETANLLPDDDERLNQVGYGLPLVESTLYSSESRVTLVAESTIPFGHSHYYELPFPQDFLRGTARRPRRVTVALAYTPTMRSTRLRSRSTEMAFRVVRGQSLDEVVKVYQRTSKQDREDALPDAGAFRPAAKRRDKGTVQASTWLIGQVDSRWTGGRYVIVTNTPAAWMTTGGEERYALVVVLEDLSGAQVQMYTQLRQQFRQMATVRARVPARI